MSDPVIPERGEFWQKVFLAAISGCDGGRPDEVVSYAAMVADLAEREMGAAEAKVEERAAPIERLTDERDAYRSHIQYMEKVAALSMQEVGILKGERDHFEELNDEHAATIKRLTSITAAFVASLLDNKMNNFADLVQAAVDAALSKQEPKS